MSINCSMQTHVIGWKHPWHQALIASSWQQLFFPQDSWWAETSTSSQLPAPSDILELEAPSALPFLNMNSVLLFSLTRCITGSSQAHGHSGWWRHWEIEPSFYETRIEKYRSDAVMRGYFLSGPFKSEVQHGIKNKKATWCGNLSGVQPRRLPWPKAIIM